jgi:hypothetical protein
MSATDIRLISLRKERTATHLYLGHGDKKRVDAFKFVNESLTDFDTNGTIFHRNETAEGVEAEEDWDRSID